MTGREDALCTQSVRGSLFPGRCSGQRLSIHRTRRVRRLCQLPSIAWSRHRAYFKNNANAPRADQNGSHDLHTIATTRTAESLCAVSPNGGIARVEGYTRAGIERSARFSNVSVRVPYRIVTRGIIGMARQFGLESGGSPAFRLLRAGDSLFCPCGWK